MSALWPVRVNCVRFEAIVVWGVASRVLQQELVDTATAWSHACTVTDATDEGAGPAESVTAGRCSSFGGGERGGDGCDAPCPGCGECGGECGGGCGGECGGEMGGE